MYNPKFNYVTLERATIDGQRKYTSPTGDRLPSVTTILDATKSEEKKQILQDWRNRVGHKKAQEITTEAANRGTKMHAYLEHYIRDGVMKEKPGNFFHHPSWHMANVVISQGLANCDEFWGIEVPLYFPSIYAGTTDCVGMHRGIPSIIDFKQSNKPKKREWIDDYFLQLCAYSQAHDEIHGTSIKQGVIMMCVKPEVDATGKLTTQPEYQEFILQGDEFQYYRDLWWRKVEQYYLTQ
jgi:genome maintenance exonuclease 1